MAESRKVTKLLGAAGAALIALSGAALADGYEGSIKDAPADEGRKFTYSFTATGTSDYVFRGISQTENEPAIQGAVNVGYGILYAGIWASNVDFGNALDVAEIEVDYYAGIKPTWGPATFDFGVIYYAFPGYSPGFDPEVLELKAGVSGEILKGLTAGATLYYSPDYNDLDYFVYEGTLAYTLPTFHIFTPTISGVVGQYDWDSPTANKIYDYTYWNVGLALAVEKLTFDFRYWDTDASSSSTSTDCFGVLPSTCGERFVFSVSLTLP
jgi:uncharacterized protein (TIGR02001 family)